MKCDELTPIDLECNMGKDINGVVHREPWKAYDIDEVDEAIAELKQFAEDACLERDDNQTAIDELQAENAELKAKLESVQASAYADSVDAGMRERRPRRATWLEAAKWCATGNGLVYDTDREKIDTGIMFKPSLECEPIMDGIKVRKWSDTEWHEPDVQYLGIEDAK